MNAAEPMEDAVTGGPAVRAAEPVSGVDESGRTTERACLNCGTALAGDYCHRCGQKGHVHRSLGAFAHDMAHGVLHFEGRIWRTLPLLAWHPGLLTRRYIEGQRARFVGPLPLFLFFVFLMFAVAGWTGGVSMPDETRLRAGMTESLKQEEAKLATLKAAFAAAAPGSAEQARLRRQVEEQEKGLSLIRSIGQDGLVRGSAIRLSDDLPPAIGEPVRAAVRNPQLLLYKLKNDAYKYSWALIPLSVPILWLLFPFSRRFRLYDHMVFVTYSLCFMSMLAVVAMLWGALALPGFALLLLLPPIHMYRQLRGAYSLTAPSALWRAMVLSLASIVILGLFGLALLALGLLE